MALLYLEIVYSLHPYRLLSLSLSTSTSDSLIEGMRSSPKTGESDTNNYAQGNPS